MIRPTPSAKPAIAPSSELRCEGYEKVLAEADAYTPLSLPPALETLQIRASFQRDNLRRHF
jgi:hypothetical protein